MKKRQVIHKVLTGGEAVLDQSSEDELVWGEITFGEFFKN
jgi:hypothetical protein